MNGYGCRADKIYEIEKVCLSKYPMITMCYLKRMSMNFRNMFFFLYVLLIQLLATHSYNESKLIVLFQKGIVVTKLYMYILISRINWSVIIFSSFQFSNKSSEGNCKYPPSVMAYVVCLMKPSRLTFRYWCIVYS
jgi:hypothetical protein